MSGSVKDGKDLEVIFFDQDATIPATLPYSKNSEKILQWLKENVSLSNKFDLRMRRLFWLHIVLCFVKDL